MKKILILFASAVAAVIPAAGQDLYIDRQSPVWSLRLDPTRSQPTNGTMIGRYVVETSRDLRNWEPFAEVPALEWFRFAPPLEAVSAPKQFYRLAERPGMIFTTERPDEMFGYAAALREAMSGIDLTQPHSLLEIYPLSASDSPLDWDPTGAEYFDRFNTDIAAYNESRSEDDPLRQFDFRLNEAELNVFREYGMVVTERFRRKFFTEMYYCLWLDHLPVYFTADSVLQPWQYSFRTTLKEAESDFMAPHARQLLTALFELVSEPSIQSTMAAGGTFTAHAFQDLQIWIAVARSLIEGRQFQVKPDQTERVKGLLEKVYAEEIATAVLFGNQRNIDFSQFKPRAHYVETPELQRYFRALMWLGRIDFRLSQGNQVPNPFVELAGGAILAQLLHHGNREGLDYWSKLEGPIGKLIGWPDSMTPVQMYELLEQEAKHEVGSITGDADIASLYEKIEGGEIGFQQIQTHFYYSPLDPRRQIVMPRSMTFLGQRFALDSWVLNNVVYDRILDDIGRKVLRRLPSCLDVAFAAFGNNAAGPTIVDRMNDPNGRPFRDGLPYQNNLAGLRTVIDQQAQETWTSTLYNRWLDCLRELSVPVAEDMPSTLQTKAWRMKDLNTQLASWTQLRHATVLYVKQSTSGIPGCLIPEAYVEPRPGFWRKMREMALEMESFVSSPAFSGPWQAGQRRHYANFAETMGKLEAMAIKETRGESLSTDDLDYFQSIVEVTEVDVVCAKVREYGGWYPQLYYPGKHATITDTVQAFDALVTDVHTNPPAPDVGDPGAVLHEGVGSANFVMVALDHPNGRKVVYGGPVLSHYEFDTDGKIVRLTDAEWLQLLSGSEAPSPPEWTACYLVPDVGP